MVSLRRHVLTIVAVFLAVALGVVLGATSATTWIRDAVVPESERTSAELTRATAEADRERGRASALDRLAEQVSPVVAAHALDKKPVLVVSTPSAPAELTDAAVRAVVDAGGSEAGRVVLGARALDPAVDTETQALVANLPLGEPAPGPETEVGAQLGRALGRALLGRPADGAPLVPERDRQVIVDTLAQSQLVTVTGRRVPAALVLVVSGEPGGAGDPTARRVAALARELDRTGAGTVLAAPAPDSDGSAAVQVLRAEGSTDSTTAGPSTVDDLDSDAGRLATVLALAEQGRGAAGAYGIGPGARSPLPAPKVG